MPVTTPMAKLIRNKLAPELRHLAPGLILGLVIAGLHKGHKPAHAQGEGDEEQVIDGGQSRTASEKE